MADSTGDMTPFSGHASWVNAVAYSPDGATLATSSDDGTIRIWDIHNGETLRTLSGHTGRVQAVAYSPNGATLATGGEDGTVQIWDTHSGKALRTLSGHTGRVRAVAYSPNGATLATIGDDYKARIWDARSGKALRTLSRTSWVDRVVHAMGDSPVAYSPDGATLATIGDDYKARIWDARSGELLRTLSGHTDWVQAVAYSPDGATLATGGEEGTIRIWNPRTGRQIAGTGFGVVTRPMRPLAGVRSDQPSEEDLLGIGEDVETLAALVTAAATEPPLAIALLGDWGAGKSSVMRQMQRQVQHLAELSLHNLGLSSFAANVRQVSFNAWHYSDDRLWTGLIEHLFRELAAPSDGEPAETAPADAREQRRRMHAELADLRTWDEHLTVRLTSFDSKQPRGILSRLGSPTASARLLLTGARELLRDVQTYLWLLVAWVVVGAGAYLTWLLVQDQVGWLVAQIGAVAAPLLVIWQRLRSWHRSSGSVTNRVRTQLERRRRRVRQDAAELTARLAEVDAAVRLSAFLDDRSQPSTYQEYRGLLGQVHRDLQRLDADLRAARGQWQLSPTPTPPLERIVLYIDDLDRCPPQRVVEVLAAVHLMLALPLFVVVVAVDPRWLLSSLRHHYRELSTAAGPTTRPGDGEDLATPLDYLDKIFQIPFAVAPLRDTAASTYLNALLRPDQPAAAITLTDPEKPETAEPSTAPSPQRSPDAGQPQPDDPRPAQPQPDEALTEDRTDLPTSIPRPTLHPEPTQPGPPGAGDEPTVIPDLRPQGLQMSPQEIDFMAELGRMLPTPRAAKKLVNLYRLIRIRIRDGDLPAFLADHSYQPVQVLLALLVGTPNDARLILTAILAAQPTDTLLTLLGADAAPGVRDGDWITTQETRQRLIDVLKHLDTDTSAPTPHTLVTYQQWCPRIARYSFHTRTLTKPESTVHSPPPP